MIKLTRIIFLTMFLPLIFVAIICGMIFYVIETGIHNGRAFMVNLVAKMKAGQNE
jgi:phosphotransferase system  glucose/maltose/N-acetylglucosamine-specific IIC component